jgi:hypothetical protein
MKFVFLLAMAFTLLAQTGCEKQDAPEEVYPGISAPVDEGTLTGAWELRMAYGGYGLPNTSPVHAPGNGRIWHFTDSAYALYSKGQLLTSGRYNHIKDTSQATGTLMDAIVMPTNGNLKIHYGFTKDTLVLFQGTIAADGTIEKYVRVPLPTGLPK